MSAVFKSMEAGFEPMSESRLDEVVAIERRAYGHPWTRGNFSDSLRSITTNDEKIFSAEMTRFAS